MRTESTEGGKKVPTSAFPEKGKVSIWIMCPRRSLVTALCTFMYVYIKLLNISLSYSKSLSFNGMVSRELRISLRKMDARISENVEDWN